MQAEEAASWGDDGVAKRGIVNKAPREVQSDARDRLTAAAQRILDAGQARDMVHAWALACNRNPEFAQMMPNDDQFQETEPTASDSYPYRRDPTPKTRSAGGRTVRVYDRLKG